MGKTSQLYFESETENTTNSADHFKKTRNSILKYTKSFKRKNKCKLHSRHTEPEDIEHQTSKSHSQGSLKKYKPRGILKHTYREKEKYQPPSDQEQDQDDDEDSKSTYTPQYRCLVGRVPQPMGKPGRGGGFAIVVRKSDNKQKKNSPKIHYR